MANKIFIFLTILFFSLISVFPLSNRGLIPTHDGESHIVRFYEFNKVLTEGSLYPRWAPDLNFGYGIPLFNYVYPLPNYFASLFHFFGASFIDAFKLNMFFATTVGAVFFYLWTKEFWGKTGGLVSSIFYTFSPYHFVDIYVRGSVGEVFALAFFPALLWSITNMIKKGDNSKIILSGIFLSVVILSHNILALMFFVFFISYVGFLLVDLKYKKQIMIHILYVLIIGLGLSSIFWMPALFETQYAVGLQIYDIQNNFPELYQLIIPSWGSGFDVNDLKNQMSFQIGIANLFAVIISLIILIIIIFRKDSQKIKLMTFFMGWFILVFILMLKMSLPIWEKVPLMNYFQFPWRFLSLEILISSFLAGSFFNAWNPSLKILLWFKYVIALFFILLSVLLTIGYTKPAYYLVRDDSYYVNKPNFIDGTNSPGNIFNTQWMNRSLKREKDKIRVIKGDSNIVLESAKSEDYKFNVYSSKNSELVANIAYFPGWTVFVDDKIIASTIKDGLISFIVPKGNHILEIKLLDTNVRTISKFLFVFSLIFILLLLRSFYYVKIKK